MPDPEQIPHLLKLLDDESETVRGAVAEALAAFGPSLQHELARMEEGPDEDQLRLIQDLLRRHQSGDWSNEEEAEAEPLLKPGQLVRHRRYGYRGVVVDFDLTCQAKDDWYFANRTQPKRFQPWYHVLVDGGQHVTYAAQTSLEPDSSHEQVAHPLLQRFFSAFHDGRYVRNDTPWPDEFHT